MCPYVPHVSYLLLANVANLDIGILKLKCMYVYAISTERVFLTWKLP